MRRPRRILFIEANEDGSVGGSHQALLDLVRGLDPKRYEAVTLFYQDNLFVGRLQEIGAEIICWDPVRRRENRVLRRGWRVRRGLGLLRAILRRFWLLKKNRIDLVHINNSPAVGSDDWLPAARLARIPIVANAMGDAHGASGRIHRWLFTKFDHVLAVSRYIEDAMIQLGVPAERVSTVNHGVDADLIRSRVTQAPEAVRAALGVPPGRALVMMVANVRHWKGQAVVLEALARMSPVLRNGVFVCFAGGLRPEDQDYRRELDAVVTRYGLQDCVRFLGERRDVPDLLFASEIVIHSSVIPEPGGIVVLEAMALGNAVIAADQGGHVEYLKPGYGILHDVTEPDQLASALAELACDPRMREAFAQRARSRVAEYSIARNVYGFQRIYAKMLANREGARSRTVPLPTSLPNPDAFEV